MMMRTDFQAMGHGAPNVQDFTAPGTGTEGLPVHPRLSKPVARHDLSVTLLGAGCAVGVLVLLGLLFSLG
jgi:hypothetical protein